MRPILATLVAMRNQMTRLPSHSTLRAPLASTECEMKNASAKLLDSPGSCADATEVRSSVPAIARMRSRRRVVILRFIRVM